MFDVSCSLSFIYTLSGLKYKQKRVIFGGLKYKQKFQFLKPYLMLPFQKYP